MIANALENIEMMTTFIIFAVYIIILFLFLLFSHIIMIGRLQGNAIKVTERQFSEINALVIKDCEKLGIKKIPTVYIMQSGGILNAFATRFVGRNYVVLYSDIIEKAFENGIDVVDFIIAHELVHIRKKHIIKRILIFPANIILLLTLAYSRACEYTCDINASKIVPSGAQKGLVLLSAGKHLYNRVIIEEYINDSMNEKTFAKWFAEILSTHPHLVKRIVKIKSNI
jgi:Zn-dependent protease with chaperone function